MPEATLPPPAYPQQAHIDRKLVWLTSFPKSGNTWTRILIGNFLREPPTNGEEPRDGRIAAVGTISSDRPAFDGASGLPSADMTPNEIDLLRPEVYRIIAQRSPKAAMFLKSHDAFQRNSAGFDIFPADCTRGAILIVRHPMDVALSYAHHLGHSDPERVVNFMCDTNHTMARSGARQVHQRTMGWSGHYLSWTRQDAVPVLVVRYEDLLADTPAWFARMLRFLGIDGAGDAERVEEAVALSRFDRLQAIESREGFPEIPVKAERFFRSGRAGEGVKALPAHLRQRILDEHAAVMAELGYSQDGADRL